MPPGAFRPGRCDRRQREVGDRTYPEGADGGRRRSRLQRVSAGLDGTENESILYRAYGRVFPGGTEHRLAKCLSAAGEAGRRDPRTCGDLRCRPASLYEWTAATWSLE